MNIEYRVSSIELRVSSIELSAYLMTEFEFSVKNGDATFSVS